MADVTTGHSTAIERWGPFALVLGGFLTALGLQLSVWDVPVILLFTAVGGLSIAIGLGGIHSEIAGYTPRLASLGGVLTAISGLAFAADFVMMLAAIVAGVSPDPLAAIGAPSLQTVGYWTLGGALVLASIVGLWTGAVPRPAGLLLVVAALSFPGVDLVEHLSVTLPDWLSAVDFVTFAVALVVAGVRLDAERVLADGWVPPRPADDDTGGDWTSEHVRDEYDLVDFEDRISPFGMQMGRMLYELVGYGWTPKRHVYPVRRALGRLLNREAFFERTIVKNEYLIRTVEATDRGGAGSPYWRLGVASLVGIGLASFLGLWWLASAYGSVAGILIGLVYVAGGIATLGTVVRTLHRVADET